MPPPQPPNPPNMAGLLVGAAVMGGAYWTGWLYWVLLMYGAFALTMVILSGTKAGKALLAFGAEPRPTTAAGWLQLGTPPPRAALPAIQQQAPTAALGATRLPETGKEKKRRRRRA